MSTSPLRPAMVPVMRQMRVLCTGESSDRDANDFRSAASGLFPLNAPPAPWIDLGWIDEFDRYYDTPTDVVRAGANALPSGQFVDRLKQEWSSIFGSGESCKWHWQADRST